MIPLLVKRCRFQDFSTNSIPHIVDRKTSVDIPLMWAKKITTTTLYYVWPESKGLIIQISILIIRRLWRENIKNHVGRWKQTWTFSELFYLFGEQMTKFSCLKAEKKYMDQWFRIEKMDENVKTNYCPYHPINKVWYALLLATLNKKNLLIFQNSHFNQMHLGVWTMNLYLLKGS